MGEHKHIVLVADDDFYVRSLVKVALGKLVEVVEAESGELVLPLYKQHKPALVFLDIHMPKRGGLDVLKDILAIDPNAHIAMLSADSVEENVKHTYGMGAKGFVAKPFTKDALLKYVSSCPSLQHLFHRSGAA